MSLIVPLMAEAAQRPKQITGIPAMAASTAALELYVTKHQASCKSSSSERPDALARYQGGDWKGIEDHLAHKEKEVMTV